MGTIKVASVAVWAISAGFSWGAQADMPLASTATADLLSSSPASTAPLSIWASTQAFLSSLSTPAPAPWTLSSSHGMAGIDQHVTEAVLSTGRGDLLPLKVGEPQWDQNRAEEPTSTLYSYQMDDQEVATVYLKDLPVISFVEHPDLDPPLLRASQLVAQLNQLAEGTTQGEEVSLQVEELTQDPEDPQGHYVIHLDDQQLLPIDEGVLLTGDDSHTTVALTAVNRLRRLLFRSPPIKTAPPLPQDMQTDPSSDPIRVGRATEDTPQFTDQGYASWYGHGRHPHRLTAAHRELPFGTQVRVTNLENGKSTVVTIDDRGPFLRGRVIDLSRAAAQTLDMIHAGVVKVQIEVVGP